MQEQFANDNLNSTSSPEVQQTQQNPATARKCAGLFRYVVCKFKRAFRCRARTKKRLSSSSQHPQRLRNIAAGVIIAEVRPTMVVNGVSSSRPRTRKRRTSHLEQPLPGDNWEWESHYSEHSSRPSSAGTGISPKTLVAYKVNQKAAEKNSENSDLDLDSMLQERMRHGAVSTGSSFPKRTKSGTSGKNNEVSTVTRPHQAPVSGDLDPKPALEVVHTERPSRFHGRMESDSTLKWVKQAREEARREFEADMATWGSPYVPDRSYPCDEHDNGHLSDFESSTKTQNAPNDSENNAIGTEYSAYTETVPTKSNPLRGNLFSSHQLNPSLINPSAIATDTFSKSLPDLTHAENSYSNGNSPVDHEASGSSSSEFGSEERYLYMGSRWP